MSHYDFPEYDSEGQPIENRSQVLSDSSSDAPSEISEAAKRRVRAVDINNGRCLVENCIEEKAVNFVHCLPRYTRQKPTLLDSLEWFWNMKRGSLNVDTSYNIFRLSDTWHQLYENNSWLLLPQSEFVDIYYNALYVVAPSLRIAERDKFPQIQNGHFKYQFIPIPGKMESIAILHQKTAESPTPADFTVHTYPFDTLPIMTSHLHPRFAICSTGQKLARLRGKTKVFVPLMAAHPSLIKVFEIYAAWIARIPDDFAKDETYDPPEPAQATRSTDQGENA